MPIEEYPGKTGVRLIARAPVEHGSYALIHFTDGTSVTATDQGRMANGWPALSPVFDSLPAACRDQINAERSQLLHDVERYLDTELYPLETFARTRQAAREQIRLIRGTVPVFSTIRVGKNLMLVVPLLFPTSRYQLGQIAHWEIFNS